MKKTDNILVVNNGVVDNNVLVGEINETIEELKEAIKKVKIFRQEVYDEMKLASAKTSDVSQERLSVVLDVWTKAACLHARLVAAQVDAQELRNVVSEGVKRLYYSGSETIADVLNKKLKALE